MKTMILLKETNKMRVRKSFTLEVIRGIVMPRPMTQEALISAFGGESMAHALFTVRRNS